jgi:hypothetical protein
MTIDRKTKDTILERRAVVVPGAGPGKRTLVDQLPAVAAPVAAPAGADALASGDVHAAAARGTSGSAGPLPYKDQIQRSFGAFDVGGIAAHGDAAAAEGAHAMGAQAFAAGNHVAFAGAPDLHTAAHEAAHVVQQRAGVQLKGGVGAAGDPYERHADEVADLVVQGKSSEALLATVASPAAAGNASASAVQRKQRQLDGVTIYKMTSVARLQAAGYKFSRTDGYFDIWVKLDGSSELWVQLPRVNAETSKKSIGQLHSIVAARRAALDEIRTLAQLANSTDPDVAAEAKTELDERIDEFPGFDDDYALVPKLREQVDADHRQEFEDQVKQLVEARDDWDPQSEVP